MKSLGILTTDEKFNSLITQCKRAGVDAKIIDHHQNINKFEVLIIDLGYPKELAYTYIMKITSQQENSEKILMAAISNRSQIIKLRSIALGCDDYISPSIQYPDLIRKVKLLEDPEVYNLTKKFDNTEDQIFIDAAISHISENGCIINSKASLSPDEAVNLSSSLFHDLQLNPKVIFRPTKSKPLAKRSFLTEIHFIDLNEEDRNKIRKLIHGWSV